MSLSMRGARRVVSCADSPSFITLWLIDSAGYEVLIDADGVIWVCFYPLLFRLWLIRAGRLTQLD